MKERKAYGKGYLEGYEAGLNEAWKELIGLTMKGYSGREIRIVANTKREEVRKRVEKRREELEAELGMPLREELPGRMVEGVSPADLRPGQLYLVESPDLLKGATLFNCLAAGGEGLCIARATPEELSDLYSVDSRSIWLTKAELNRSRPDLPVKEHVSPTELPQLNSLIRAFVREAEGRSVLIEGIDYLILNNSMESVRRFLNSIKDEVYLYKAIVLICVDPSRMRADELTTLRNEVGLSV